MTTAGEICCRELVYAMCDTTIHGALQLMRQSHVDAVIVMSTSNVMDGRQRTLGIVSDSDVTSRVYATELDPSVITLGDIVLSDSDTLYEDAELPETIQAIRSQGLHHLLVINQRGDLIGTISKNDLFDAMAQELNGLHQSVARSWAFGTASFPT